MPQISFEWDEKKHSLNKRKHGISFTEAQTAFTDENGLLIDDPDSSEDKDRLLLLGLSVKLRVLVVCHTYRESNSTIRIISARKGNRLEQEQYWERWSS